ncbi:hypothetical protein [Streptomyces sp. NPDC051218]|uniref:hypothetical protein n=1 Tax=Streptomyces sp. NPDC051218 TaxID=3365645 RepID=UPI00379DF9ED
MPDRALAAVDLHGDPAGEPQRRLEAILDSYVATLLRYEGLAELAACRMGGAEADRFPKINALRRELFSGTGADHLDALQAGIEGAPEPRSPGLTGVRGQISNERRGSLANVFAANAFHL